MPQAVLVISDRLGCVAREAREQGQRLEILELFEHAGRPGHRPAVPVSLSPDGTEGVALDPMAVTRRRPGYRPNGSGGLDQFALEFDRQAALDGNRKL